MSSNIPPQLNNVSQISMWWHCCKTKLPRGFLADNFPQWKAIKTLPPSLFLARRKQNRNVRRSNEVSRTLKRLLRNIWSLKDIHQKNWESTSSWKQIHTCASFLALRKRANMEISIRLIAGGIPARAPLLIKPSAEDRTLIKKPCRTVVPLNRGSGRAIAFFFFFLLWCDYIWLLSKQRLTSAGRSDGDSQTYWRSDLQSSNTEADRGRQEQRQV